MGLSWENGAVNKKKLRNICNSRQWQTTKDKTTLSKAQICNEATKIKNSTKITKSNLGVYFI